MNARHWIPAGSRALLAVAASPARWRARWPWARKPIRSRGRSGAAAERSTSSSPRTTPTRVEPAWLNVASFISPLSLPEREPVYTRRG